MVLTGEAGSGLVVIVGGKGRWESAVRQVVSAMPAGPVVLGPRVEDLAGAGTAMREALAGLDAVASWPEAPCPVPSSALLAERAVLGDVTARDRLLSEIYGPLAAAGGDLLPTVSAFLDAGGSIEGASRALFVHANTVRYRIRKVRDLVGLDVSQSRDARVTWVALLLGRAQRL
jgi:DNA-binding PucR family transcriptional regulator